MTRLPDPRDVALKSLVHARAHYAHGVAPMAELEAALGSRENVWQVVHRLRLAGHTITTHRCPRGDRTRGGYQLVRLAGRHIGFEILGGGIIARED